MKVSASRVRQSRSSAVASSVRGVLEGVPGLVVATSSELPVDVSDRVEEGRVFGAGQRISLSCERRRPSPVPTGRKRRSLTSIRNSEVDSERPAGVATGGSLRAASRTRRAPPSAPGSPQIPSGSGCFTSCRTRPRRRDLRPPVVVALGANSGGVEQCHTAVAGPDAVAST